METFGWLALMLIVLAAIGCGMFGYQIGAPKGWAWTGFCLGFAFGPLGILIVAVIQGPPPRPPRQYRDVWRDLDFPEDIEEQQLLEAQQAPKRGLRMPRTDPPPEEPGEVRLDFLPRRAHR